MAENEQAMIPHTSPFDAIRHVDEHGNEYWSARELGRVLGYQTNYRNFQKAIRKAEESCKHSGEAVSDHIAHVRNMIPTGKGAHRSVEDVHLSRYGAYLAVQNADPEKQIVALAQTYFAVQTRRQELAEQMAGLPEDQRRLIMRSEMAIDNQKLNEAARRAGLTSINDFAIFTNHGYRGLYDGLSENDIHARKGLTSPSQKILDYMGTEELGANIFRATQAEAKLRRENVQGTDAANQAHLEVGQEVRETIKRLGGTMPEDLPTPDKSIQQLRREEQRRLLQGPQLSLFEDNEDV